VTSFVDDHIISKLNQLIGKLMLRNAPPYELVIIP